MLDRAKHGSRRAWQSGQGLDALAPKPHTYDLKCAVAGRPSSRLGRSGASAGLLGAFWRFEYRATTLRTVVCSGQICKLM